MNKVIEKIKSNKSTVLIYCFLLMGLFLIWLSGITLTFDATFYGKEYHFYYEDKPIYRLIDWYYGVK